MNHDPIPVQLEINNYYHVPQWGGCIFYVLSKDPNRGEGCYNVLYIDDWIEGYTGKIDLVATHGLDYYFDLIDVTELPNYVQQSKSRLSRQKQYCIPLLSPRC